MEGQAERRRVQAALVVERRDRLISKILNLDEVVMFNSRADWTEWTRSDALPAPGPHRDAACLAMIKDQIRCWR